MKDARPLLLSLAAVAMLYLVWGALHDISQANSSDYALEYSVLVIGVPVIAFIWRAAFRILTRRGRIRWLGLIACILLWFDLAALSASLNPKYTNDSVVGSAFLAVSLPLLGYVGYRLVLTLRPYPTSAPPPTGGIGFQRFRFTLRFNSFIFSREVLKALK